MAPGLDCDHYDLGVEFRAPDETWRELHGVEAAYLDGGEFTLHGEPEPWADHRLLPRVRGHCSSLPEPIAFSPGARDLHIEVASGGSLRVHVATPLTIGSIRSLSKVVDFVLEGVGGAAIGMTPEELAIDKYGNVKEDGLAALYWNGLRSGTFRLRALAKGTDSLLAEMPLISVSSGSAIAPGVLDLNGALYRFQLDVVGPDGAALRNASVDLSWGGDSSRPARTLHGSNCHSIAPRVPVELTARAKGYVTDSRPLTPGPQQVVLQPSHLASTRVQVMGLDLPAGVHADLVWGPANLPRAVGEASGFGAHEDAKGAADGLRVGKQALVADHAVEFEQPIDPASPQELRLILALSALPPPHRPEAPPRVLLDSMPGWLLSNPLPTTATLVVDAPALRQSLAAMGRD